MSGEQAKTGPKIPGLQAIQRLYRRSSPRRRLLLGSGVLTFVIGLALLGLGLAGLGGGSGAPPPGPAVIDITPSPTPEPRTSTPVPTPTPVPAPPLGDQPYRMVIAKLGVDAPVDKFGLDSNNVPQVPTGANANQTVAWYDFSARPGIGSNAVFAGHVTWNGPAVFYKLTSLAADDEIKLVATDGTALTYKVTNIYSVNPSDPESLTVMHATPEDVITIITCDGTFTDTNDPVFGGEYSNRLVVRAARADVAPPPAPAAREPVPGG